MVGRKQVNKCIGIFLISFSCGTSAEVLYIYRYFTNFNTPGLQLRLKLQISRGNDHAHLRRHLLLTFLQTCGGFTGVLRLYSTKTLLFFFFPQPY